jgi:hypothetical protein
MKPIDMMNEFMTDVSPSEFIAWRPFNIGDRHFVAARVEQASPGTQLLVADVNHVICGIATLCGDEFSWVNPPPQTVVSEMEFALRELYEPTF